MSSVSIVIPNWNGKDKLKNSISSALKIKEALEVIVVDDGSTDNSVEFIRTNFSKVRLIVQEKNLGFSSTVNRGVKEARGDLVFLLNSDALAAGDCLEYVLSHFRDERVFSVGLNSGGSWSWAKFEKGYFWHFLADKIDKTHQTLWVSGGSGVFRKSMWENLGGLDVLFNPFYEEDLDLGYRATKRGCINLWEPRSKVLHSRESGVIKENFPKEFIERISQRNQLYFIWKNIADPKLTRQHIWALFKKLLTSPRYWAIFLSAFIHLPAIYSQRQIEKQQMKLSDLAILNQFKI